MGDRSGGLPCRCHRADHLVALTRVQPGQDRHRQGRLVDLLIAGAANDHVDPTVHAAYAASLTSGTQGAYVSWFGPVDRTFS